MPTYLFEAMDAAGQEIRDEIEAPNEDKAQETIRQMGYFVTKISVKKARKSDIAGGRGKKRGLAIGGVRSALLCTFTRQLSILQDAGLPILRSLRRCDQAVPHPAHLLLPRRAELQRQDMVANRNESE